MLAAFLIFVALASLILGLLFGFIFGTPDLSHALLVAIKVDARVMMKMAKRWLQAGVDVSLVQRDRDFAHLSKVERLELTDPQALKLALILKDRVQQHFGSQLKGVYLFGSRARGDYNPASDVDVLLLVSVERSKLAAIQRVAALCANRLLLEHGLYVQPRIVEVEAVTLAAHPQFILVRTAINSGILID
jgi:predicted nucleotidyltransferase